MCRLIDGLVCICYTYITYIYTHTHVRTYACTRRGMVEGAKKKVAEARAAAQKQQAAGK